jgi:hypothetical protein
MLDETAQLGTAGMPTMFDERKGPRVGIGGKVATPKCLFDLTALVPPKSGQCPKQASGEQKKASKAEDKAKAAALKARTIHVIKPFMGWEQSPSTKLAAANWGLIETLVGATRKVGENNSYIELVLSEQTVERLKSEHDWDIIAMRIRCNKGDVRPRPCLARAHALPVCRCAKTLLCVCIVTAGAAPVARKARRCRAENC